MILLDSNIVIGYLNGDTSIVEKLGAFVRERRAVFISLITFSEVLCLPEAGNNLAVIEQFLNGFIVIEPDKEIAKSAAAIRRKRALAIPDAYIVATAIVRGIPLATRDKKDAFCPWYRTCRYLRYRYSSYAAPVVQRLERGAYTSITLVRLQAGVL